MTEKTTLKEVIDKSFDKKDINEVYKLMSENGFSATDLKVLYKKELKKKYSGLLSKEKFWSSKLPHLFLKDILKTDLKNDFLDQYFEQNEYCNHQLNQVLVSSCLSDFLVFFKINKAFRYDDFMNSLGRLSTTDPSLKVFYKEVLVIRKVSSRLIKAQNVIRKELAQFSLDDFLLVSTLWNDKLRRKLYSHSRRSEHIQYETTLIEEFNSIFRNIRFDKNTEFVFSCNNNRELQEYFKSCKSINPELIKTIATLINRTIKVIENKNKVDLYLTGFANLNPKKTNSQAISLKTNKDYTTFCINDRKKGCEEMYFFPKVNALKIDEDIKLSLKVFNFYGVSKVILYNNQPLDTEKVFSLLTYFSNYKVPKENNFNQAPNQFREYFGLNESITLFDYKELLSGIQEFFKWEKTEVENILNFLTFDLSAKDYPKNWMSFPFLRIDNKIVWLGSFLRDRRWENILINKIKLEKGFEKLRQIAASNFEIRMEELFRGKGFKTNRGYGFKNCDGESGEIDLIAYKDNYLFICEVKSSIRSDDFSHSVETQNRIFEGKAAHQLIKCETNIQEDWNKIKQELCIDIDLKLEDIKIIPLIVTDHFEGDLALYLGKYQKVSFLELDVIMNNTKKELLEKYLFHEKSTNAKFRNINIEEILEECDLWYGHDELKVEFIEQNIKDNSVWKGLEQLIDTNYRELTIPMMMD